MHSRTFYFPSPASGMFLEGWCRQQSLGQSRWNAGPGPLSLLPLPWPTLPCIGAPPPQALRCRAPCIGVRAATALRSLTPPVQHSAGFPELNSLPFASPSACEVRKTPWQDFSLMMRKESPRSCPPRRRKPLPKRTQPRSEITVEWACYVPRATAVDSLNFPTQIQRPHQAGSRGLRSWTKRSSVSGKREGRGDGSTREWGWGSQVPGGTRRCRCCSTQR